MTFGDYTGAALKVEAVGNIQGGNITINQPDSSQIIPSTDPDFTKLTTTNALILRAGLASVNPTTGGITQFTATASPSAQGSITVGSINTSSTVNTNPLLSSHPAGSVELQARGDVTAGTITTTSGFNSGVAGDVGIKSGKNITFSSIDASSLYSTGGNVNLDGSLIYGSGLIGAGSDTISTVGSIPGNITIKHDGGPLNIPFSVNANTANGVRGSLNAGGTSTINSLNSFPVLPNGGNASGTPPRITITSVNTPPTLADTTISHEISSSSPNSVEFTYEEAQSLSAKLTANAIVNDAEGDAIVFYPELLGGKMTINGIDISTSLLSLKPGEKIVYTPNQPGTVDKIQWNVRAFDGLSFSASKVLTLNLIKSNTGTRASTTPNSTNSSGSIGQSTGINQATSTATSPTNAPNSNRTLGQSTGTANRNTIERSHPQEKPIQITPPDDRIAKSPQLDAGIEDVPTNQFVKHLGLPQKTYVTPVQVRDVLMSIETKTGIKPAVIYAKFRHFTDELDLILVTSNGEAILKPMGVNKAEVLKVAENFRLTTTDSLNDDLEPAQQMYKWLVKPLEGELRAKGINNLLFVTDEGLRSIPLAALHDGNKYIIEKYSVGFTPSLSLTDTRYTDIKQLPAIAMGASKFKELNPLPSVPAELAVVTNKSSDRLYLNENFTLNNVNTLSARYRVIHFGTHGQFRKGKADKSYIQLWGDRKLRLNDLRELELYEIPGKRPPVELFVLSACETALGDVNSELGFGGLAAQTGAKTVLASLWTVDDAGTLGLMTEFYSHLKTAPIKAEALRRSQLAMLHGETRIVNGKLITTDRQVTIPDASPDSKVATKNLIHPYYWAAFTMIGNPW